MMPRVWRPSPQDIESYDDARKNLARLVLDNDEELARLSRKVLGKNDSYLWQYFTRRKPQSLPEDARYALAAHFQVDEALFRSGKLMSTIDRQKRVTGVKGDLTNSNGGRHLVDKVPVLGRAIAGSAKIVWDNGRIQEWVDRPPYLANPEAYAVYVNGESMEDRYYAGERIYVDPTKPLTRGCFVVVQCNDDSALVKQYLRHDNASVELRQLNPDQILTIPTQSIRAIHRIVGSSER